MAQDYIFSHCVYSPIGGVNEAKIELKSHTNLPKRHSKEMQNKFNKSFRGQQIKKIRPMERPIVKKVDSSRQRVVRFRAEGSLQIKRMILYITASAKYKFQI